MGLLAKQFRNPLRVFVGCLLWAIACTSSPGSAEVVRNLAVEADNRLALVIGNAAYPGVAALKNPVNDATDIAAKLKTLNFKVTLKTDVGLKDMLRALTEFGDKIQKGAEVLFFYAGHGMQVRGRNYLIPIDAAIRTESAVSSEAVDVDQLLDKLSPARLSMVILDACRNNPFERRFRGGGQGLASINAPNGTLIAYATAPGKTAADGEGRNGLYTQELLAAMDTGGLRIEDVFKHVRVSVMEKSGDAQTPWESSSLTGDFYFVLPESTAPDGRQAPAAPTQQAATPQRTADMPSDNISSAPELDGIWTIASSGLRIRIENGSVYEVEGLNVLLVAAKAGRLVARDLIRIGPGAYRDYDLNLNGEASFQLQPDGSIDGVSKSLGLVPIPWKLYPLKLRNEAAYREAVQAVKQLRARAGDSQAPGRTGSNAGH